MDYIQYFIVMNETRQIAQHLDRVMRKVDAQMHRRMPFVDKGRVGPMGALCLMHLEAHAPCPMQTIAREMGRDNSQLTRLVRDLDRKGLVARSDSPADGRITLLHLTPEGRAFLKEAVDMLETVVSEIVEPLSAEQRKALCDALGQI